MLVFLLTSMFALAEPVDPSPYAFVEEGMTFSQTLRKRFSPPDGYRRISIEKSSFGEWLRDLPLQTENKVLSFRGQEISAPSAAVVPLDVGRRDVQQCADSILRLYAEYRWSRNEADQLVFHFTSGDRSGWKSWRNGERFRVKGSKVKRVRVKAVKPTHAQFRKWLTHTFLYAGTRSLHKDARRVPVGEQIQPGDFFVSPGSPGHAVMVLDVAESELGPPVALLGQGFMPAQSFHVLRDSGSHVVNGWFVLPRTKSESLQNPSWSPLPRTGVYRFE